MFQRLVVVAVVFLSFAATMDVARAFDADDAGTGGDAGNSRNDATYLPAYGAYEGDLVGSGDDDWYWRPDYRTQPVCVVGSVSPAAKVDATLRLRTANGTRTVTTAASGGSTTRVGMAAPSLWFSRLGVENGPSGITHYGFQLSTFSLPAPDAGDAGTAWDAGSTRMTALPTSDPCVAGNLVAAFGLPDVDAYAISVAPGQTVYYSVASAASTVTVELTDAAGALVGPVAQPGDVVGVYLPSGGTYYMSASSSSPTNAGYLLGLISAVEPPTNPCRPSCLVVE